MRVVVVDHDSSWDSRFESEAERILQALGSIAVRVHHIGSTAIPGIVAKPIIDMLVEATSVDAIDEHTAALVALGYEAKGEFGIPGRRYFRRNNELGQRAFHMHIFVAGSDQVIRHLAFRDYLRSHADTASAYSQLKTKLAQDHSTDVEAYISGKDPFIRTTEHAALAWWHADDAGPSNRTSPS